MSFFHTPAGKYSNWLFVAIGLGLATVVSASAVIYIKSYSTQQSSIPNTTIIDKVFVDKSERRLQLLSGDTVIKSYHIALGGNPIGHKQQEGDNRTPVGSYTLDYKNENSIAHRSIHVSYPNAADKARAQSLGIDAGGDIMIHGQMNGFGHLAWLNQKRDWTEGCIAVTNEEMDEIMAAVNVGTPIEIVE
ncbi:L,D-transpeptidase family protein [Psychrobacter alimentarius]|uniref:L,D-transpeptidase family protein n=1 Tax=Psychrobacter alimentarius TaxID=261164 RepID=UPI003FD4BE0D